MGCQDEYDHYGAVFKKEDANLIAAAPELLSALQSIVLNANPKLFSEGQLAQAKAAIDKATGAE